MREKKFTPGPWAVQHKFNIMGVGRDSIFRSVASSGGYDSNVQDPTEENTANAHLISAAPELLESLEEILDRYKFTIMCSIGNDNYHREILVKAHNAILKAYGETND